MRFVVGFAGLATLLHPVFLTIYRLSVFNTVPRDDYAPFLLWLLGKPGGFLPDSPYCYRVLSMLVAAPFYAALPAIPLTNTPPGLSPEYLKATAALAMVAYLAWVAAALLAYAAALRATLEPAGCVLAAALVFASMLYVQFTAIDPLAIMLIAAGVLLLDRPWAFASLLAGSILVNEKVALVLGVWLAIRCVLSRQDRAALGKPAVAAVLAVAGYVAIVALVGLPGNPYQRDPAHIPRTVLENLAAYGTWRGLLLNAVPILVLLALALIGKPVGPFRRRDALVIPALAIVALVLTQLFQAGRIVMHAAPIVAIPAAAAIAGRLRRAG